MKLRTFLSALMAGAMLLGPAHSQELYYGDDDDMSPEEYYLEGIGYGAEDYGSGVEDTSYSGLYSPSEDEPIYGGNTYGVGDAEPGDDAEYGGYALPASPVAGGGDAGDWFSMSGVSILEVVGDDSRGYVLITKDTAGEVELLSTGEEKAGAFKVLAIGSEQVKVEPSQGGPSKTVPILHRSAPTDAFLLAVARLENLRLVIGAPLSQDVSFEESMLEGEQGFAEILGNQGFSLQRFDDVLVARKGEFPAGSGPYRPDEGRPEGDAVDLSEFRSHGDAILEVVSQALPAGVKDSPEKLPDGTTALVGSTPAAEALHYLNLAWGTEMVPEVPEDEDGPAVASNQGELSADEQQALFRQAVQVARAGDLRGAGKRLLQLCRGGSRDPKHFRALGKIYWKLNRIRPAVKAWKAAYRLDPQDPATRRLLVAAKRKIQAARSRS